MIPRFALSCSEELLAMCGGLLEDVAGAWFTTHLNESKGSMQARLFQFWLETTSPRARAGWALGAATLVAALLLRVF